jgi:hypothetical protein
MMVSPMVAMNDEPGNIVPAEEALAIIERLEQNWERVSFRCESLDGTLANIAEPASLVPGPTFVRSTVTVEPLAQRARVDLTGVFRWLHGVNPYLAMKASYGFGETFYRQWEVQRGGFDIPTAGARGIGEIGPEDEKRFLDLKSMSGIGLFPPFLQQERLSQVLRRVLQHGQRLEIRRAPDGTWEIDTIEFGLDEADWNEDYRLHIDYDPSIGGVVTGAAWSGRSPNQPGFKVWKRLHVELVELGDGLKAPHVLHYVNLLDRSAKRVTFLDIRRNVEIDPAIYRIQFPLNIHVTDHIHDKMYVVGSGLENDRKAVQAFMERYGFLDQPRPRMRGVWVVIGLLTGALAVAGLVWLRNRRSGNEGWK